MQPYAPQGYGLPNPRPMNAPPAARAALPGEVSERTVQLLDQTKGWVLFFSVLCFLGTAIMLGASVLMLVVGSFMPKGAIPFPMSVLAIVYLPLAAFYVYPAKKLWGYGSAIGRLTTSRSTSDLEAAMGEQKSFWKFVGIATICLFGVYFLMIAGFTTAAAAAAAGH